MTPADLIRLLLATPLLAWVPGWLAWQVFGTEGADSLKRAERVFLRIFVSLLISASLATVLAELGILSLASLLTGLVLTCLVLWKMENREWRMENGKWKMENGERNPPSIFPLPLSILRFPPSNLQSLFSPWTAGLLAILALAAVLFFRPAEAVLVMDDAGVYVIRGLTLARTGGLDVRDPVLPSLSSAEAQQLLPFLLYESSYIRQDGFYIWQWGRGLIRPSFFHLPSIWMAVLALFGGPRTAVWATPLAGLVAVGGFVLLSRRLFGPAVGLGAALLVTLSFPQVWYARYPTSEMFMQAWLLGGLLLLALFLQYRRRFFAVAAGVALGQLFLIRVDAWVAALAIGLCFAGWFLKDQRDLRSLPRVVGDRWFLVPLGLTLGWAGLHAALFASPYVISLMHMYLTPRVAAIAILGAVIVVAAALAIWHRPTAIRVGTPSVPTSTVPRWIAGLIMAGVWAVVLIVETGASVGLDAIQWLSWYFTPLGLAAALVGLVLMIWRGISRPAQVMLLIALLYALLYLPAPRARPTQPWGVRRFVPEVLPALILVMAYFAVRFPVPGSQRLRQAAHVALTLILALILAQNVRPVVAHDEYAGAWDQMGMLADRFEPGAVVLFNQTGVGQAVAQPLTYLYDRPAFVLQAENPDRQVIKELAYQWTADGRSVYLAITGPVPWLADLDAGLEPAGDFTLRIPRLERPTAHPPRKTEVLVWPIELYRVVPGGSRPSITRLDMGPGELPYVREGFYGRETMPDGTTFRWTDGAARISLPVSPGAASLALRVSGPPPEISRPTLTVLIDRHQVGAWELPDGFISLSADVPAGAPADGRLDIELRSDTWVPKEAGRGDDDRRLGVVVDWIAVTVTSEQ